VCVCVCVCVALCCRIEVARSDDVFPIMLRGTHGRRSVPACDEH